MSAPESYGGLALGIVGVGTRDTGTARGEQLARVLAQAGGHVVAFCDLDEGLARRAAAAFPGARSYGDLDDLLDAGVDGAVICTPVGCHVDHAARCLARGVHVLSEVPAADTLEGARRLVDAAERSDARYMLAENYCYYDEVELVKRMVAAGRFGDLYFAEGAYVLDWKRMWRGPDGALTWRGRGFASVYCTHALGPILYWLDDRIAAISCLANPASVYDAEVDWSGNHVMLMRTAAGRTVLLRVDTISSRPADTHFALQGSRGAYVSGEQFRSAGKSVVWLADEHARGAWQPIRDYAARYMPERADELRRMHSHGRRSGRGYRDYRMAQDFLTTLRTGAPPRIDVHAAMDYTLPGIVAEESARQGGAVLPVPDSREWAR